MNGVTIWFIGLAVTVVIVLVAAGLLIAVLMAARSIEEKAGVALAVVKQIRDNTMVIWALQDTNYVASQLQGGAEAILANAVEIVTALHEADEFRGGQA